MTSLPAHLSDAILVLVMDDELPATERESVELHLASCAMCRDRLAAFGQTARDLEEAYDGEPTPGWLGATMLRTRVRAQLDDPSAGRESVFTGRWTALVSAVPISLLVGVAVLGVALLAAQRVRNVSRDTATASAGVSSVEPDALPVRALTPGATWLATADDLCSGRPVPDVSVPASVRQAVLHDYGMEDVPASDYELDYLITPELAGATDPRNLWPERYTRRIWNARVKDELERLLPQLVCQGTVDLKVAQHDIAADWVAAYKKYFHTDRPVGARASLDTRSYFFASADLQALAERDEK